MEAYTSFASVYDTFMDNIPYEEWEKYLKSLLYEYGVREGLVLELGCGTGNMTEILAQSGYDMIGVDNAEEMLEIAIEKRMKSGLDILYLQQDMSQIRHILMQFICPVMLKLERCCHGMIPTIVFALAGFFIA